MYRGGYTGKILRVDLTEKSYSEEPLPVEVAQDFIGGAGFCVKYLYDEVAPDCDPLSPENKLIYAPGPFTGTTTPCASRMAINANVRAPANKPCWDRWPAYSRWSPTRIPMTNASPNRASVAVVSMVPSSGEAGILRMVGGSAGRGQDRAALERSKTARPVVDSWMLK